MPLVEIGFLVAGVSYAVMLKAFQDWVDGEGGARRAAREEPLYRALGGELTSELLDALTTVSGSAETIRTNLLGVQEELKRFCDSRALHGGTTDALVLEVHQILDHRCYRWTDDDVEGHLAHLVRLIAGPPLSARPDPPDALDWRGAMRDAVKSR